MHKHGLGAVAAAFAAASVGSTAFGSSWTSAVGDVWTNAARWTPNAVPNGSADSATISATGADYIVRINPTVSVTLADLTINSANATLECYGGLSVSNGMNIAAGQLQVPNGVFSGDVSGAGSLRMMGGEIQGSTIRNAITFEDSFFGVSVTNGLTFVNGSASLADVGGDSDVVVVKFVGTQTLGGTGTLYFDQGGTAPNVYASGGTLTIGSGITATTRNANGKIGNDAIVGQIINQGIIQASTSRTMTLAGVWTNQGTLKTNGGTLVLGGTFKTSDIGTINRTGGGTLKVAGTVDNVGATFAPSAATGDIELSSGVINGGIVAPVAGTNLTATGGSITNASIAGIVKVTNGLTISNVGLAAGGELQVTSILRIGPGSPAGSETVNGPGKIRMLGGGTIQEVSAAMTFGSNLTVQAEANTNEIFISNPFVNKGIIRVTGGELKVQRPATGTNDYAWSNEGQLIATSGGQMTLRGTLGVGALGTFDSTGGTIKIAGSVLNDNNNLQLNGIGNVLWIASGFHGGTVTASNGAYLNAASGQFFNAYLDTDVVFSGGFARLVDGSSFASGRTVKMNSSAHIDVEQPVFSDANVLFEGPGENTITAFDVTGLTISAGTTIKTNGGNGVVSRSLGLTAPYKYTSNATVLSEVNGISLTFTGDKNDTLVNNSLIRASNGGILKVLAKTTNNGTMSFTGVTGEINLAANAGTVSMTNSAMTIWGLPASVGNLSLTGGTLSYNMSSTTGYLRALPFSSVAVTLGGGTLDNTGDTISSVEGTRTYKLGAGTISGGSITGGTFTVAGQGTMTGVSVNTPLIVNDSSRLTFINGSNTAKQITLTASGTLELNSAAVLSPGVLILMNGGGGSVQAVSGQALTIPSGVTVKSGTAAGTIGTQSRATSIAGTVTSDSSQAMLIMGNTDVTGTINATTDVTVGQSGGGTKSSLTNNGRINLGLAGDLVVNAAFTQSNVGLITMDIGGTGNESYSQIVVNSATLGGDLDVELVNGYVPAVGSTFTLLSSTTDFVGQFTFINMPSLGSTKAWQFNNTSKTLAVTVVAVPEPSVCATAAAGLMGLLLRRRRGSPVAGSLN
jgi:hypothetical protein